MKHLTTYFVLFLLPAFAFADSLVKLDSLQKELSNVTGIEKAEILIEISEVTRNISFSDCINYGLEAVNIALKEKNYDIAGKGYKSLGVSCYYAGDLYRAFDYYKLGLKYFIKASNTKGMSDCFNNIGLLYDTWSKFDSAYYYYNKSLLLEEKLNNKRGMALSLINMGNINYYRKNFKQALDNYYRAMLLFKEAGDVSGEAMAFNSLGIIYWYWDKPEKALKYFKEADSIYSSIKEYRGLSRVYLNMAEIYNDIYKEYKKSLIYYKKALNLKRKLDDKEGIALVYNDMGALEGNMENIDDAIQYFNKSYEIYSDLNNKRGLAMVLHNFGKIYQKQKKYKKAIEYYKQSLNYAEKIGLSEYITNNYEGLFRCYAALHDTENFEKYYEMFSIGQDSLNEMLQKAQIAEIEAKYKVDELIKENYNIRKDKEAKEKKLKSYRLIFTATVGIIILLLFTYVMFFRLKK